MFRSLRWHAALSTVTWPSLRRGIAAALVTMIVGGGGVYAFYIQERHEAEGRARSAAQRLAEQFKDLLSDQERAVLAFSRFSLAEVRTQAAFERITDDIAAMMSRNAALQWAPGGVLQFINPLRGSESVVGLNLRTHPTQGPEVERTIASGQARWIGPFTLNEGDVGMIYRLPVYADGPSPHQAMPDPASPNQAVPHRKVFILASPCLTRPHPAKPCLA